MPLVIVPQAGSLSAAFSGGAQSQNLTLAFQRFQWSRRRSLRLRAQFKPRPQDGCVNASLPQFPHLHLGVLEVEVRIDEMPHLGVEEDLVKGSRSLTSCTLKRTGTPKGGQWGLQSGGGGGREVLGEGRR